MHVSCGFCRPAHALYFATYELAKESLGGNNPGHHPVATAVAGSIATVVNDGVMTPSDVVKQRLQVANSPYRGVMDCILRVSKEAGPSAFFRSYRTTVSFHSFTTQRCHAHIRLASTMPACILLHCAMHIGSIGFMQAYVVLWYCSLCTLPAICYCSWSLMPLSGCYDMCR